MDSDFLEQMTTRLAARGVTVARFEFGYMAARRADGKRRPPPKMPALKGEFRGALATLKKRMPGATIFIGGKSMGGRVASMIAASLFDAQFISGCVCLGYPFHPAGRPEVVRTAHLTVLACPTLIVQGVRDSLGCKTEVEAMTLAKTVSLRWINDGDHDLRPRVASGHTWPANLDAAADAVTRFMRLSR